MGRVTIADQLERLAGEVHAAAFDWREPSRSIERCERMIARIEDIAARLRAAVRGGVTGRA